MILRAGWALPKRWPIPMLEDTVGNVTLALSNDLGLTLMFIISQCHSSEATQFTGTSTAAANRRTPAAKKSYYQHRPDYADYSPTTSTSLTMQTIVLLPPQA